MHRWSWHKPVKLVQKKKVRRYRRARGIFFENEQVLNAYVSFFKHWTGNFSILLLVFVFFFFVLNSVIVCIDNDLLRVRVILNSKLFRWKHRSNMRALKPKRLITIAKVSCFVATLIRFLNIEENMKKYLFWLEIWFKRVWLRNDDIQVFAVCACKIIHSINQHLLINI